MDKLILNKVWLANMVDSHRILQWFQFHHYAQVVYVKQVGKPFPESEKKFREITASQKNMTEDFSQKALV